MTDFDDDPLPVKRCVCFEMSFASLKAAGVRSADEAEARFGCGSKCGACVPYIQLMIYTGRTEFAVIALD
ncbi:MAG: hypothetical protein P4L46_14980 [Fimbriimonas sp.]|nr:hypothetical protein [Fimbriimonas sp.]